MTLNPSEQKGFTLLELLVAMLLVSMVTVIISVAFRLGVNSWDRSQREGDSFQARIVIPSLLQKQLAAIVRKKNIGDERKEIQLPFIGTETSLSFFTTYTAMAGSQKGLLRVTYLYDPDNQTLTLFQQVILTLDDLEEIHFPLSDKWDETLVPSGSIDKVTRFQVRYAKDPFLDRNKPEDMSPDWLEKKPDEYPAALQVAFHAGEAPVKVDSLAADAPEVWYFNPGLALIIIEDALIKEAPGMKRKK